MKRKNSGRERGRGRDKENQEQEKEPQQAATVAAEAAVGGSSTISGIKRSNVAAALPSAIGNLGGKEALRLNAMAATIARNISSSSTSTAATMVTNASNHDRSNASFDKKRFKPNGSLSLPSSENGRGYTVAVGKGVRHQLNGYLRSAATPFPSSADSNYAGLLSRPSASATSLRFQEPSELGMSLEGSLSQLRASFTAAGGGGGNCVAPSAAASSSNHLAVAGTATAVSASTLVTSSDTPLPNKDGFKIKIVPSALTRRVSPHFVGGMLRCDDSLINLAMLPTLDSVTSTLCENALATASAERTGDGGNVIRCDYMAPKFAKDDSLVNLAAAVEKTIGGGGVPFSTPASTIVSASNNDSLANLAAVGLVGEGAEVPLSNIAPSSPYNSLANHAVVVDMESGASSKCAEATTSSKFCCGPRQGEIFLTGEGSGETFSFIDFQ